MATVLARDVHGHLEGRPPFLVRWLCSTNHKDIGVLYMIFAIMAGVVGGVLSGLMRWELYEPGVQLFADGSWLAQLGFHGGHGFNVVVTAHALIMIFCTVMPAQMGADLRPDVLVQTFVLGNQRRVVLQVQSQALAVHVSARSRWV